MVEPIKPGEVENTKAQQIPDFVVESFNELIAKNWNGKYSKILQKDVVDLILTKTDLTRSELFARNYLDVEYLFKQAGRKVKYDKPVYYAGENFEPYFEFRK